MKKTRRDTACQRYAWDGLPVYGNLHIRVFKGCVTEAVAKGHCTSMVAL